MGTQLRGLLHACTPTLAALALMSFVALTVGLERLFATLRARHRLARGRQSIVSHLQDSADARAALAVNGSLPTHPATGLFALLLKPAPPPSTLVRRSQAQLMRRARRRLWLLGTIASLAPFVGLMGTVVGIMEAFAAMGVQQSGGLVVVSQGISEALVTTAAGILVAIEAVLLFNYLQVCIGAYAGELRDAIEEIGECRQQGARVHA